MLIIIPIDSDFVKNFITHIGYVLKLPLFGVYKNAFGARMNFLFLGEGSALGGIYANYHKNKYIKLAGLLGVASLIVACSNTKQTVQEVTKPVSSDVVAQTLHQNSVENTGNAGQNVAHVTVKGPTTSDKTKFSTKTFGVASSPRITNRKVIRKGGGRYQVGKPYTIRGKRYYPREDPNYSRVGLASWYGPNFHGRLTANGEVYDQYSLSAAHPTLPLPSYAKVTNLNNGASVIVRINDRGPFAHNRIIDLSARAAQLLGYEKAGVAKVKVEYAGKARLDGLDEKFLVASYNPGRLDPSTVPGLNSRGQILLAQNEAPRRANTARRALSTLNLSEIQPPIPVSRPTTSSGFPVDVSLLENVPNTGSSLTNGFVAEPSEVNTPTPFDLVTATPDLNEPEVGMADLVRLRFEGEFSADRDEFIQEELSEFGIVNSVSPAGAQERFAYELITVKADQSVVIKLADRLGLTQIH